MSVNVKIEYLPLALELLGLFFLVIAIALVFGAVVALILASIIAIALGLFLERRRSQQESEDEA